ncbi:uncharacterized protein LOC134659149 [Cydia amplana]|uniref:uncharacterized protein LOC134659149 n=1 Tax=Cydia amplana TaxID=1869771 RepID=UPI002FE6A7F4
MVIHEDSECPVEIAVIRKPEILEPKKYLMINNHIRELINKEDSPSDDSSSDQQLEEEGNEDSKKRGRTSSKKSKKRKTESEDNTKVNEISESDLSELRTVYQNCLAVINKIELKYGHLLNIDTPGHSRLQNGYNCDGGQRYNECHCIKNKKIVFDDDGQQHTQEIEDHICPPMPKKYAKPAECSVTTDSEDYNLSLPDDLPSLAKLLQDPELNHRNKVIDKIKSIKQDHLNELRFNRPAIIQAIKRDPNEVLGFLGVNFASLPGYS